MAKMMMMLLLLLFLIVAPVSPTPMHPQTVLDWILSNEGGYFNDKNQYLKEKEGQSGEYAVHALKPIYQGELLFQVPWSLILNVESSVIISEDDDDEEEENSLVNCALVHRLLEEWKTYQKAQEQNATTLLGPYLHYIESKRWNKIPSTFSDGGQDLLLDLLGDWAGDDNDWRIPPFRSLSHLVECHLENVVEPKETTMTLQQMATLWVVQKADDRLLVPLLQDIYPHGNGDDVYNTKIIWKQGHSYGIYAARNIEEGEALTHSFNLCVGCLNSERREFGEYGTAELFRDYGFVEPFPQTWILDEWAFELDVFEEDGDAPTEILLGWITELPHQPGYRSELIKYLQQLHTKLMKTRNQAINLHYHNKDSTVPLDEWNLILNYHEAIADALAMAYNSFLGNENDWLDTSIDDNVCSNVEECASISHYDSLQQEDDDLDYISPTCYNGEWMQFNDYDDVEILKTSYQNAKFNHNPTTGDVCMDLDTILQICSSYRPHYHEFVSHFPARFIDTLKRVVFVGGGDSMLLHEALQYPTIEKVVGLELDQTVTRKCFKYFQTQPHFDDDRVEWWFGDATKSLLLLPKEYWGSFDLVLVDLSETVMALSVTDDLDVFDALALLLKPEGVMVKNEIYMEDMSKVFDYTIQIHYDSPKICSQMLVMGSNRVDFFHQPQKDHNLNHHLLLPLDKIYDRFEYMHDYRKNDARLEGKCDLPPQKETTDEQDKRAGILYVMDVENITALDIKLEEFLYEAVQGADLTPISTPSSDDASVAVVVLKEGFAIGRFWPEEKYAAVGIHLWGSHHKAAVLENHLMTGFQTSSLSSFRVVVGGMYGSTTWTEDQSIIGPQIVQNRNCDIPSTSISDAVVADAEVPRVVVDEFLNLVHSGNLVIGVVCGFQESEDSCVTNEIVEANPNVDQVITFWACPDLNQKSNSNVSSILPQMFACENAMIQQLDEAMDEGDLYFDMFAIDSSAPYEMAQIFNSVWSTPKYRSWYIAKEHNLFLGISLNPKEEDYQRNFLDRYRKDVRDDPTTRAEIIIHQGSTSMEVGVVSVGDEFIFHNLHIVERKIQQRLGENVDVDLRKINGGQWKFKEDYEPREFSHEDYDTAPGLQQFHNQKPLGRETIFQFLLNTEKDGATMPSLGDLTKYLEQTLSKLRFTHTKSTVFTEVGDGVVIVSISKEGSAVLVWDGRDHVDVNLFNRVDRQELADAFSNSFVHFANKNLKVALRDDYPRGTGRVVNFYRDITVPDDGAPKM